MFIDSFGTPMQELAAIEMDVVTKRITDVFYALANCEGDDSFPRLLAHGLSTSCIFKETWFRQ